MCNSAKLSSNLLFLQLPYYVMFLQLLFLWAIGSQSQLAISMSIVQSLPGFQGLLPFKLETGYVGVGESEETQLFYYFVESERNPENDPLILWLTGGPGCSAWSGLVFEIGPLNYKVERYNGSLPTLQLNPYSWTKISNIIFVDSPVGTGFSYGKSPTASQTGDSKQVNHLYQFFIKWLIDHPKFTSNPVFIAGDSYSGIFLPLLVNQIVNGIEKATVSSINLQGYLLGNPVINPSYQNFRIPFAHGVGLISDELYESLKKNCGGKYFNIDPSNIECSRDIKAYDECTSRIDKAHILEPFCPLASPKTQSIRRSLIQNSNLFLNSGSNSLPTFGCREYEHLLSYYWANDHHVREALRIRKGSIRKWQRCNFDLPYEHDVSSSFPYIANINAKGYRSLIYSGDHDMLVPFLDTQTHIRSLNYSIVDDWRPWFVQEQVGGYTRTYSNRMTFATVKGAGHTAPQYKPKECYAMFKRWIEQQQL